jgi:hypothetical protein
VHILTDIREPSGQYRDGLLITSGERATTLLLAGSDGKIGHGRILTENGTASDVGPRPGLSTRDEWAKVAIKTAVHARAVGSGCAAGGSPTLLPCPTPRARGLSIGAGCSPTG